MSRNTAAVAELTRRLVSVPSHANEQAAGDAVEAWLRAQTDAVVRRDSHGNVIARRGDGEESLALVGHHDVVDPDVSQVAAGTPDSSDPEYIVEEREERLYGRGTADMKGSLAAAMCAFRDADPAGELVFASFMGEEQGGVGARAAIDDGFVPDYAVVGEGTTGYSAPDTTDIAIAHRGRRGSTLHANGTAAHASEPDAGDNAVYRACNAVNVVRDLPTPETTVLGHQISGSIAVTGIEGGSGWNVIPEACNVTIDERTVPDERVPLDRADTIEGIEWTVDQDLPPMACDDGRFANAALAAADAAQSGTPEHVVKPHATDAGWLAGAGTTCIVAGASEPGEAHTADESVSLAVVERCRRLYVEIAERWSAE